MNIINELKLAIYESSLDREDKHDLINIVESTDDEDILCDIVDVLEATRLSKEINKVATGQKTASLKSKILASEIDSLGIGREIAKMQQHELDELFDGEERGSVFKQKIDDGYKNKLIKNDPKHNLKHAVGSLPGPKRVKIAQKRMFNIDSSRTPEETKQAVKNKYKNWNGVDYTTKKGPYNFYGTDLKNSDMIHAIIKNAKKRNKPKEMEKLKTILGKHGYKL